MSRETKLPGFAKYSDIMIAVAIIGIIVMLIIPLPAFLLDVLLTFNITFALLIILVTMYTSQPLEFSVFPSLLLFITLFRLALNVASTRLILLHGYAGQVISAFGNFVVGGNYVVGMVVFLILIIIQFVVITKGTGRIAEVAARFTLDAMPGKQMSIDADLNTGLITDEEARARRRKIEEEAEFYGAMDGASKFVRGDAIAGVIITIINIIGGFIIGVVQLKMPLAQALQTYTLLTIGDGLVTQIPALIISTAAGIIVTKAASQSNLGQDLVGQMLVHPRAIAIAAGMLIFFGIMPGLPKIPFFFLAVLMGLIFRTIQRTSKAAVEEEIVEEKKKSAKMGEPEKVEELLHVDPLELEIGYGLIPLVNIAQGGDLLNRVTMIRRQCALDLGLIVPPIRIRDNMQLPPSSYAIKIEGIKVAQGELMTERFLAMDPGVVSQPIEGIKTTEPVFGLPAVWISENQKERAELNGYTVIDSLSVLVTHLTEVVKSHAHEILSRQDVQVLLDNIKADYPAVVEGLVPNLITLGGVQRALQNLLRERVSIRNLVAIIETLADYASLTKDADILSEHVRQALSRTICQQYQERDGIMSVITLDPRLEQKITESIQHTDHGSIPALEPNFTRKIFNALSREIKRSAATRKAQPIILCSPAIRIHLKRLTERVFSNLVVLSYNEIIPEVEVKSVGMVTVTDESEKLFSPNDEGSLVESEAGSRA